MKPLSLWSENKHHYDIYVFKCRDLICGLTHGYHRECVICIWENNNVYFVAGGMFCICLWDLVVYCVVQVLYFLTYSCLVVLRISESGVLNSPAIIVGLSISPCSSLHFCFMDFDGLSVGAYMIIHTYFSCTEPFYWYVMSSFVPGKRCDLKSVLSDIGGATPLLFWLHLHHLHRTRFPSFPFQPVGVFGPQVSLADSIWLDHVFQSILPISDFWLERLVYWHLK